MGCNCGGTRRDINAARQARTADDGDGLDRSANVAANSAVVHEVLTAGGVSTGRKFMSIISAQAYATRLGGTIRTVSMNG